MVTKKEVKTTIAVAIAGAFGFIVALIWRDIIMGLLNWAGLSINDFANAEDPVVAAIIAIVVGIIITVICVFGILYITKWGGVEKK
jgi:large-conductance mechanosensitive channel